MVLADAERSGAAGATTALPRAGDPTTTEGAATLSEVRTSPALPAGAASSAAETAKDDMGVFIFDTDTEVTGDVARDRWRLSARRSRQLVALPAPATADADRDMSGVATAAPPL
jgi:hypothetical protein